MRFEIRNLKPETWNLVRQLADGIWDLLVPASRMKLQNITTEVIPVKMGVNLCCGDGSMAEHFLHSPQVGPALDEMGGKRMAESMRADRLPDSGLFSQVFNDIENHHPRELLSPVI